MKFSNVVLESIAEAEPPEVITSVQLEERLRPVYERLKLPFGRLELMTGIRERRFWPLNHRPSPGFPPSTSSVPSSSSSPSSIPR